MVNPSNSKILLFSDLHLGLNKDNPMFHDISLDVADWIDKTMQERNLKTIIFCGDFFHNRKQIGLSTINTAYKFLDKLKNYDLRIIVGNHDCFYLDNSSVHSLSLLKQWTNITIYDEASYIAFYSKKLGFIPWGVSVDEISECDYLFGHFEINGFQMSGVSFCKDKLKTEDILKKSKCVISGHFHKPQINKTSKGKIIYLGSPFQHNWGEAGEDKFIYELDISSGELVSIKNEISPKHINMDETNFDIKKVESNIVRFHFNEKDESYNDILNQINSITTKPLCFDLVEKDKSVQLLNNIDTFKSVSIMDSFNSVINELEYPDDFKQNVFSKVKEIYELCS